MLPATKVVLIALGGGLAFFIALVVIIARRKIAACLSKMRADWLVDRKKPTYAALMRAAGRFEDVAWELPELGGTNDWTRSDAGWAVQYYKMALAACKSERRSPTDRAAAEAGLARVKLFMAQLGQAPVANLWESIEFSRRALETYTPKSNPEAWGSAQLALAAGYCERNKSSHYDIEQAIGLCEKVIECLCCRSDVCTVLCAQAHYTKAEAHFKQSDLQHAERHYKEALTLLEPAADRKQLKSIADRRHFARALCGLGWTQLERIRPVQANLIEDFMSITSRKRTPPSWRRSIPDMIPQDAEFTDSEKAIHVKQMQEEAKILLNRLSEAEQYFQRAAKLLRMGGKVPPELSEAREGIADVTELRRQFFPNLTQTIQPSHQQREILERKKAEIGASPMQVRQSAMKRGDLYFNHGMWEKALKAYYRAIDADETLFYHSVTEQGRRASAGQGERAYRHAAFCQMKMEEFEEALLTLDYGKTRVLSERLARDQTLRDLKNDPKHGPKYQAAVREYTQMRQRLEQAKAADTSQQDRIIAQSESVERARDKLRKIENELQKEHPDFLAGLSDDDLPQLVTDNQMAVVVPVLTGMGGAVILVTAQGRVEAIQLPDLDQPAAETIAWKLEDEQVKRWLDARDDGGWSGMLAEITASDNEGMADKLGWVPAYRLHYAVTTRPSGSRHYEDARKLTQRWWREVMQRVLEELYEAFWHPILKALPNQVKRLIVVPQGVLHMIPVGAAVSRDTGKVILDHYAVSYAPSLSVLEKCRPAAAETPATKPTLLAALGSQGAHPLPYIEFEIDAIARIWKERIRAEPRLLKGSVTEEAFLKDAAHANYIHYSGHGKHDRIEPLESGLLVKSGHDVLTVKEIQDKGILRMSRLVVLSACESGLVDTATAPEEYVGLPAAFLVAGAPCVVSSLWPVNDIATALLMEEFYRNLIEKQTSTSLALIQAQRWLRTEIDRPFVIKHIQALLDDLEVQRAQVSSYGKRGESIARQMEDLQSVRRALHREERGKPGGRPFDHPFYWAAFVVSGAQVTMTGGNGYELR
jgi:CHAT domain-containing protein